MTAAAEKVRNGALRGKTVVVTGAESGIGRAMAKLFARDGAKATEAGVIPDRVDQVVKEIRGTGEKSGGWCSTCPYQRKSTG